MKLFRRGPPDPKLKRAYDQAFQEEMRNIQKKQQEARMDAVRAKARAAASRESVSRGSRALGGFVAVGKALNNKLDKFDSDKFEKWVTGVGEKKKDK